MIFPNFLSSIFVLFLPNERSCFCQTKYGNKNTLIYISEELSPSFFRRKIEYAHLMREEFVGKVFFFQPVMLFFVRVLLFICNLTWRANNFVSRQRKGINRTIENTRTQLLIVLTTIFSQFSFSLRYSL